jgi:hypothetical protein
MSTGILITGDRETRPTEVTNLRERADLAEHVAGPASPLDLLQPAGTLWVNDNFRNNGMPFNPDATAFLWVHAPKYRLEAPIHGPAVLTGPENQDGMLTPPPAGIRRLLLHRGNFRADAQFHENGPWASSGEIYPTWATVYERILGAIVADPTVYRLRVRPC